jgi:hypothetical protein
MPSLELQRRAVQGVRDGAPIPTPVHVDACQERLDPRPALLTRVLGKILTIDQREWYSCRPPRVLANTNEDPVAAYKRMVSAIRLSSHRRPSSIARTLFFWRLLARTSIFYHPHPSNGTGVRIRIHFLIWLVRLFLASLLDCSRFLEGFHFT